MNNKICTKLLIMFLAVITLFSTSNINIVSAEDGLTVVRGGDTETFIDSVPVNNITAFIDVSKINNDNCLWETTIDGVEEIDVVEGKTIVYKGHLAEGEDITLDGIIRLTYKDAFIESDGKRTDLILELSDIYIKQVTDHPDIAYYEIIKNSTTLSSQQYDNRNRGYKWNAAADDPNWIAGNPRTARSVNFKVLTGDGSNVNFAFGIKDIDVRDYITNDYSGEYVESVKRIKGYDTVYITNDSLLDIVGDTIRPTAEDAETWNSGFITIMNSDNESTWKASGTNILTTLFETLPFHKVEDSVIGGGEIKYVKNDSEVNQSLIIASGGDNVSIVTRPLEGHKIKKITIDGVDATPEDKLNEFRKDFTNINEDHEIIAEYEPFTYKISYDANSGEGDMPTQTFTYDDATFMTSENSFTKEGFSFIGFKLEGREELIKTPEDLRAVLVAKGDGSEVTLVAQWGDKKAQITVEKLWEDIDGNPMDWPADIESVEITVEYGTEESKESEIITLTAEHPKKQTSEFTYVEGAEFSATEKDIDGYDVGIYGDGDIITVVNTKNNVVPIHVDLITIAKYWDDNKDAANKRPNSLQFIIRDSAGNVYNGTDEQKIGYLSSENLLSFDDSIETYEKHLAENRDKMTPEEIEEWNNQIEISKKMRDDAVEKYGTSEYWLGVWFVQYEGTETRTYTIEEPSVSGYTLTKVEADEKEGIFMYAFVNKLKEAPVVVRTFWVDENGKDLLPSKEGAHAVASIPGYTHIKTETTKEGHIRHIYHYVVTKHVNEKGVEVATTESGIKDKKEIAGYVYKKSETSSNGDRIHTYTPIAYQIRYELDGGTNDKNNPSTYTVEDAISIKDPVKEGYTFKGWKEGNKIAKGSTGDKLFTAVWEKKSAAPVNTGFDPNISGLALIGVGSLISAAYIVKKKKED